MMAASSDDPELALDEALKRIQGDSNESDEELPNSPRAFSTFARTDELQSVRLLCMPHRTKQPYASSYHHHYHRQPAQLTVKNTHDTVLTQSEFCRMVYERLEVVAKERCQMRQRAQNIARESGKSFKDIMSKDWTDDPCYTEKFIQILPSSDYKRRQQEQQLGSCSDSGLGVSFLGQSSSDLYWPAAAGDNVSSSSYSCSSEYIPRDVKPSLSYFSSFSSAASNSSLSRIQSASQTHLHSFQLPPQKPKHTNNLLVAYTIEGSKNIFAKRVTLQLTHSSLTLKQFKDDIFARKGSYRFFFKSYCEELSDVIHEEISTDSQTLPLFEGKIVGHVEKMCES